MDTRIISSFPTFVAYNKLAQGQVVALRLAWGTFGVSRSESKLLQQVVRASGIEVRGPPREDCSR